MKAGARSNLLWPVFVGLLIGGIVFLLIGVPLIVLGAAGLGRGKGGPPAGRRPAGAAPAGPAAALVRGRPAPALCGGRRAGRGAARCCCGNTAGAGVVYPARLSGYLDPNLSRWKWLVKWLLAIPHFIVLFFLWFAFGVVTIVAWFAILFTGRYPRSLFNFNVGVIRWSWRVAFYSLRGARHGPLSALHPGAHRLPGRLRRRLSRETLPRPDFREVLAAGLPAPADHRAADRDRPDLGLPRRRLGAGRHGALPVRVAGLHRRGHPAVHRGVLAGSFRLPDGPEPLDLPRGHLRFPDARRIPAVPPGHGAAGPRATRLRLPPAAPPAAPGTRQFPAAPAPRPPLYGQSGPGGTGPATAVPAEGQPGFYGIGGPAAPGPDKPQTPAGPESTPRP